MCLKQHRLNPSTLQVAVWFVLFPLSFPGLLQSHHIFVARFMCELIPRSYQQPLPVAWCASRLLDAWTVFFL